MHWTEVWHGKSLGARLARTSLIPLSWLYAAGWEAYAATYSLGLKKAKEPHRPVICIGNLIAGGSGKSPLVLYVASVLRKLGKEVVIGCSGYGSPHSEDAALAPDGPLNPTEWGDEPAMIRWLAPDIPLVVGRDRVVAARLCHEAHPKAILLMDDGFQHLPLRKHLSILLDPPSGNRFCLPAGPYREPRRHLKRADLVLPNHLKAHMEIGSFSGPDGCDVTISTGSRVNALCAIGNPTRFFEDLAKRGLTVEDTKSLPDHDRLQMGNLFDSFRSDLPIVVTAKDWVKIQRRGDLGSRQILIARQEARIEPESEFEAWLAQKLDELSIE